MSVPLRALIIEDSEDDAQLLVRELRRGGYEPAVERVDSSAALERALWRAQWDIVFGDYSMPHFSGTDALAIVRKRSGDVPFIFVSGTIGEDTAVAAMRAGAQDYVVKGNLKRLLPAVERELRDARERHERRQAEETLQAIEARLRQVIASTPAVLYASAVKPEGFAPSWVSENIARTMGYDVAEALQPDWWLSHLHPDDRDEVLAAVAGVLASGHLSAVYRFRHKSGGYRWIHDQAELVRDAKGDPVELFGSWLDVTERKALETQLLQSQKMEAIGRLAGGVAHDFNNLLTAIIGNAELLLGTIGREHPASGDIDEILKASLRAADLTRQLLAFGRRQVLAPRVLGVNTVVAGLDKLLRRLVGEHIELLTALAADPDAVKADPGQLEQAVMNLVVNARDAMPEGGKLTIETANIVFEDPYTEEHGTLAPGRYVMLAVSDTGVGMTPETRAHIFEPFFTTKDVGKGTGLGLAMVYGFVQQSGGYIWVYSEPGRGATFKMYLPRVDQAPEPVPATPLARAALRGSETVLLVEDDDSVRSLTRKMLEVQGYAVLAASSGAEALRAVAASGGVVHLLVTDVVLPAMSGRELAERLRAARPGVKVLYTSGYTDEAIVHHGVLDPGIAFLQKPFTSDALARKVREVLDQPPR